MFETLMRLYNCGKGPLTPAMLANAVIKKMELIQRNRRSWQLKIKKE